MDGNEITLITAIVNFDQKLFLMAIEKSSCIDAEIAETGLVPLHFSILTGFIEGVIILKNAGANLNKTVKLDDINISPIEIARRFNKKRIKIILKNCLKGINI